MVCQPNVLISIAMCLECDEKWFDIFDENSSTDQTHSSATLVFEPTPRLGSGQKPHIPL